jgi:hypothetical protein
MSDESQSRIPAPLVDMGMRGQDFKCLWTDLSLKSGNKYIEYPHFIGEKANSER